MFGSWFPCEDDAENPFPKELPCCCCCCCCELENRPPEADPFAVRAPPGDKPFCEAKAAAEVPGAAAFSSVAMSP